MNSNHAPFVQFHPLIAQWFTERVGDPTDVQRQAWPKVAAGAHLLVTGPTGSGKTLTAFLWALNQLIAGKWPIGHTSVLYISPLRALSYDIQRNLLMPLEELRKVFEKVGEGFPDIHVLTRTGDTPQSERWRMLHHPPEILISTPESLNLLLSSKSGRSILTRLSTVILDEIHAVFSNKRGPYLMSAVERLVGLSGEFQRIGLSATIQPLEQVAEFIGGFKIAGDSPSDPYVPRPVTIVSSKAKKEYDLRVCFPQEALDREEKGVWTPLVGELKTIIARNRSTLIFVNSRRLCELLTLMVNQGEEDPLAYAHHGSLSLEIRSEVERKLKAGVLRAIIATHSLELGIDIGALDEVVLIQSPFSISSAVQRVGRSGHQVNQVSRGILFPTHPKDFIEAAALVPAILNHEIESSRMILCPLDVLAQVIVSMVGVETWDIDALYVQLKTSYSFRHLGREQFDLVLEMLAGRYSASRVRELKPLISIDRLDRTVVARRGALQTLYLSGGVIPDRGYFHLRHQETHARIGELDEEFVWEASTGDTFSFGTQNWRIHQITHNDVFVLPASQKEEAAPFWKGEENGRDFQFSERIGRFLEEANRNLDNPDFAEALHLKNRMEPEAAGKLIEFLRSQREATQCSLPHRHHLVVEFVSTGPGGAPGHQAVIHTMWGGRVNRPLAMVLDAAWQARYGYRLELYVSNDCIVLQLPHEIAGEELLSLMGSTRIESLLRTRLEGSGFFGARFRECAGRALLLPRGSFRERMPLWLSRLRSQKLLEAVLQYEDFPILLETWRTCLVDEFDLGSLKQVLTELETGSISWTEVRTLQPSPFAQSDWWRQVNQYMYMDDSPKADKTSRLRSTLLRDIVFTAGLRPAVSRALVERFESKRKRLTTGYSPQTFRELLDWVIERVAIPMTEWKDLMTAVHRDHEIDPDSFTHDQDKLVRLYPREAKEPFVVAREILPRIADSLYAMEKPVRVESLADDRNMPRPALGGTKGHKMKQSYLAGKPRPVAEELPPAHSVDPKREIREVRSEESAALLGQWLQFYGPVTVDFIRKALGIEDGHLQLILEDLIDSQKLVQGQLVIGEPEEVCDSENFETLLRFLRAESVPTFEPLGIEWLPLFLAEYQGITNPKDNMEGLRESMEQLLCYPAEAGTWESEIFPARLHPYDPSWLDTLMQERELLWVGSEGHRVTFWFESDLDLLREESGEEMESSPSPSDLIPDGMGRYDFNTLAQISKSGDKELTKKLWDHVWQGRVTNDTFLALRGALMSRFKLPDPSAQSTRRFRHRAIRRTDTVEKRGIQFFAGNWRRIPTPEMPDDFLEREELRKDRARLLLDRYGILFRELLQREHPVLRWSSVFRALRTMELSGEVMAGLFFHGIPGPQFISHRAFRSLQRKPPEDTAYWINATDPASLCGIQLDAIRGTLPPRVASTHLVYRGTKLVAVSKRNGRDLRFYMPPDDPNLLHFPPVLRHLLMRKFQPLRRIVITTINGEEAFQSPYLPVLRGSFDVSVDPHEVTLYRKIR